MSSAPKAQILYRRSNDLLFGWTPLSKIEAKSYNLYACLTFTGVYVPVKINILNDTDKNYKKIVVYIKDSDIPIPPLVRYYFKLTFVSPANIESDIALSAITTVYPPVVDPHFENEAEEANNHNYAWVEENQRWEKVLLTPDGKLKTDANVVIGDITLSDIQIATLPDEITKVYIITDTHKRTVVNVDPTVYSRLQKFEEHVDIATDLETTILTFTNIQQFFVNKIVCSGTADAIFKFKISNITNQVMRNSWNNRNIVFDFTDKSLLIPAGSTITITVKHQEKLAQNFEVSIYSFTYSY
jgi:hypothetical protein